MAIRLKTPEQIERMRLAGRIVWEVLNKLGEMAAPGITTEELDRQAHELCRLRGGQCLFKGVPGRGLAGPFPGSICVSLNEQVVHGIPSKRTLIEGDIVSLDFGVRLDGWCADAARTIIVGRASPTAHRLVEATREALDVAVRNCRLGGKWSAAARAMQNHVEQAGFSVVREFVGHGIGQEMHEDPKVPNFVSRELLERDIVLKEGMVLAVEPMVNVGSPAVACADDGWTVVTKDGMPSAHFEHTIAVTAGGADVLTDGR